ncbi:MAG TPA: bifunctional aspartate kinase/homoserine dehydrogenase I, partial [Balneolaceae bacterium]|nr:bifunctional aspartate kinase/homoserine dehydrogenase I [Balneolaceae bacterium]
MIVLKFGGSSVATSESLEKVQHIVQHQSQKDNLVVVVSALGGITNQLQEVSKRAADGDESYKELLTKIEQRHLEVCNALFPVNDRSEVLTKTKLLLNDLEDICRGVYLIRELSPRSLDHILSYGEVLSSSIISAYFKKSGLDSVLFDSKSFIKTDSRFGRAAVDNDATFKAIQDHFKEAPKVSVCPGFVASSKENGHITTLGRGGSDYTAALIAAALQ